jgi:hypothetical protein
MTGRFAKTSGRCPSWVRFAKTCGRVRAGFVSQKHLVGARAGFVSQKHLVGSELGSFRKNIWSGPSWVRFAKTSGRSPSWVIMKIRPKIRSQARMDCESHGVGYHPAPCQFVFPKMLPEDRPFRVQRPFVHVCPGRLAGSKAISTFGTHREWGRQSPGTCAPSCATTVPSFTKFTFSPITSLSQEIDLIRGMALIHRSVFSAQRISATQTLDSLQAELSRGALDQLGSSVSNAFPVRTEMEYDELGMLSAVLVKESAWS